MNRHKPHIYVLPEDRANEEIANGFLLNPALNRSAIRILPPVGGWSKVVAEFENVHVYEMERYPCRSMLLIIDFDNKETTRLVLIQREIPEALTDRVFVLGVLSEPERLRASLRKSFEDIGKSLSQDCAEDTREGMGTRSPQTQQI